MTGLCLSFIAWIVRLRGIGAHAAFRVVICGVGVRRYGGFIVIVHVGEIHHYFYGLRIACCSREYQAMSKWSIYSIPTHSLRKDRDLD